MRGGLRSRPMSTLATYPYCLGVFRRFGKKKNASRGGRKGRRIGGLKKNDIHVEKKAGPALPEGVTHRGSGREGDQVPSLGGNLKIIKNY